MLFRSHTHAQLHTRAHNQTHMHNHTMHNTHIHTTHERKARCTNYIQYVHQHTTLHTCNNSNTQNHTSTQPPNTPHIIYNMHPHIHPPPNTIRTHTCTCTTHRQELILGRVNLMHIERVYTKFGGLTVMCLGGHHILRRVVYHFLIVNEKNWGLRRLQS